MLGVDGVQHVVQGGPFGHGDGHGDQVLPGLLALEAGAVVGDGGVDGDGAAAGLTLQPGGGHAPRRGDLVAHEGAALGDVDLHQGRAVGGVAAHADIVGARIAEAQGQAAVRLHLEAGIHAVDGDGHVGAGLVVVLEGGHVHGAAPAAHGEALIHARVHFIVVHPGQAVVTEGEVLGADGGVDADVHHVAVLHGAAQAGAHVVVLPGGHALGVVRIFDGAAEPGGDHVGGGAVHIHLGALVARCAAVALLQMEGQQHVVHHGALGHGDGHGDHGFAGFLADTGGAVFRHIDVNGDFLRRHDRRSHEARQQEKGEEHSQDLFHRFSSLFALSFQGLYACIIYTKNSWEKIAEVMNSSFFNDKWQVLI